MNFQNLKSSTSGAIRRGKALAVAGLLGLLSAPAALGQTNLYQVTTTATDNSSAGSLGAGLTSFATPAANDIILFNPYLSPVITPTDPYTIAGGGGGTLTIDGNSGTTLNFTGGMTVTGDLSLNNLTASGITVNTGGVLSTTYSSIVGLTLNGGTYQTRDNSNTTGITLAANSTIDTYGSNPTMSGITGTGGLTVIDSAGNNTGILTLNVAGGLNNYSGATAIISGTLQLGVASALSGGAIADLSTGGGATPGTFDLNGYDQTLTTVLNNGIIKTGVTTSINGGSFGALTVTGNYSGTGTLSVGLQQGLTNLTVNGLATLGGPLAVVGHPALGTYTVVNMGTLSGAFTSSTLPYGVTDSISYVTGGLGTLAIIDILSDTPFSFAGQSANQASIASVMNLASYSATGDMLSVINQMSGMSAAQTNEALDEIGPMSYAALSGMSFAGAGVQSAAVTQRLTGLQAGRSDPDGDRYASFNSGGSYPGTLVAELPGDSSAVSPLGSKDRLFDPNSRWGFFLAGLGTFDHLDSINGDSGVQRGYSLTATGETLGADYRFNEHFAAGVAGGYVNSYADLADGGGNVYGQSARLGAYGTVYNDSFHANLYLGGAQDFYAVGRNINSFARTATSSPSGQEFNMDALMGWDIKKQHSVISPFAGLAYDRMMLGSFTESGAGALDLAVNSQTAQSLRSTLGVKVSREFQPGWCDLTPFASVAWQRELADQSRPLTAALADSGVGSFTVMTADVARDSALLGTGLDMDWTQGFSTRIAYQSTLNFDFHANTFNGSLRWRF